MSELEKLVNYGSENIYSKEFEEITSFLYAKQSSGVYMFLFEDRIYYIGQSINIGSRIVSSYQERFCINKKEFFDGKSKPFTDRIYMRFLEVENKSDLLILESYLIAIHKPILNKSGNFEDKTTITIDIPDFSRPIKVVDQITENYILETERIVKNKALLNKISLTLRNGLYE